MVNVTNYTGVTPQRETQRIREREAYHAPVARVSKLENEIFAVLRKRIVFLAAIVTRSLVHLSVCASQNNHKCCKMTQPATTV